MNFYEEPIEGPKCQYCDFESNVPHVFRRHTTSYRKCPKCSKVFCGKKSARKYRIHQKQHIVKPTICNVCNKSFKFHYELRRHGVHSKCGRHINFNSKAIPEESYEEFLEEPYEELHVEPLVELLEETHEEPHEESHEESCKEPHEQFKERPYEEPLNELHVEPFEEPHIEPYLEPLVELHEKAAKKPRK